MADGALDFRLLGTLEVRRNGAELALGGAKQRALLAILLINANRVVTTDELVEWLWPAKAPGKPLTAIQGYVSALRKILDPEHPFNVIVTEPVGYRVPLEPGELDTLRFEQLVQRGRAALDRGEPRQAGDALAEGLALFRGPPLVDFAYASWASNEIGRFEDLRLVCLEDRIEADLALGRHDELIGELQALISDHPLREGFRTQHMLALYRSGRQAEALDAYQAARSTLVDELGVEPGGELRELHGRILNQDETLGAPVRRAAADSILPAPASRLIGRERDLAEVLALVAESRLVTLTGPGGTGKTRLALEVAHRLVQTSERSVFWVPLASLRDPSLVLETMGQVLEANDDLSTHIGQRRVLIVLDNLEQVIDAARDLGRLLAVCPNLSLVVTSREVLRVQGELEYAVPPLDEAEAVVLFCERARLEPSAEIAELCMRLDSLPLAVELAAARTKALTPLQILDRLSQRLDLLHGGRDADPRQATLRTTIEWSYHLLSIEEKQLFARLSVFSGGCTLEAAEEVCDADLDALQSLVEKSLVRFADGRYSMLETIREYAAERLVEARTLTSRRHSAFYLALAVLVDSHLRAEEQIEWQWRLDVEYANCMRALEALVAEGSGDDAALLAVSLSWYWRGRAGLGVAREWLGRAALLATDDERRLRVLIALSGVAFSQGDVDDARRSAEQAHEIALRLPRADLLAAALVQRAHTEALPAAEDLHSEARALYEQMGDSYGLATQTINLGNVALIKADYSAAASLSEEGTMRAAELGNRDAIGVAFRNLAISRYFLGDLQSAQEACVHALGAAVALDDRDAMSACLDIIAAIWARTDRVSDAAMLLEITGLQRASTGFILEIPEARVRADAEQALARSPKARGTDEVDSVSLPPSLGEAVEYVLASID